MPFFAVTLGFFVENQRESYNERQQEIDYMRSIVCDTQSDLNVLDIITTRLKSTSLALDSLLEELASENIYLFQKTAGIMFPGLTHVKHFGGMESIS